MQTDRELLELAAKAAGYLLRWNGPLVILYIDDSAKYLPSSWKGWNPLTDDGDALRLAVKLNLLVMPYPLDNAVRVTRLDQDDTIVSFGEPPDPYAATRRAIVHAAAAIGEIK